MRRCKACNLDVKEDTSICPLCSRGLEDLDEGRENHNSYPVIEFDHGAFRVFHNIFLFLAILLIGLMLFIDWYIDPGIQWSIIPTGIIVYFIITLKYSIQHTTSGGLKVLVQTVSAMAIAFLIDLTNGPVNWSIYFAIPCIVIVANLVLALLMLINSSDWETYIIYELVFLIFSVTLVVLCLLKIIKFPLLSYIALGLSITILVATFIFGSRKAKNELARRFHV